MTTDVLTEPASLHDFASRLVYARGHRVMTMAIVEQLCGVQQSLQSRMEHAKHKDVTLWTMHRLAFALDVPAWWLSGEGPVMFPPPHRPTAAAPERAKCCTTSGGGWRSGAAFGAWSART